MSLLRVPERVLLAVCAIVLGGLAWAWTGQHRVVPEVMRCVPVHADSFVVTSPLNDFWDGFAPHLSRFFRPLPKGAASSFLHDQGRTLREELEDKKIKLERRADLVALGLDGTRSAAFALVAQGDKLVEVVVLPVANEKDLTLALEKWLRTKAVPDQASVGRLTTFKEYVAGFTPDRYAVIGTDRTLVESLLDPSIDRRTQVASNDRVVRLFSAPSPRASKAWLRGQANQSLIAASGGLVDLVVSADEGGLGVDSWVDLPASRSAMFRGLLQRGGVYPENPAMAQGMAVASLGGPQLPELLRHLSTTGDLDEDDLGLAGTFSPVVEQLSNHTRFDHLSLVVSDVSSREPGVALGLQMTPKDASDLVLQLQWAMRHERDRQLVQGAVGTLKPDERAATTLASLQQAGRIVTEPGQVWRRYRWRNEHLELASPFTAADFANPDYQLRAGKDQLTYLMPPFTDNDVRLRFADETDQLRIPELKAGRFRLCSTYDRGVLWIGTDAPVLAQWLAKLRKTGMDRDYEQVLEDAGDIAHFRARLVASPRQILAASRVNPDSESSDWADQWFADLATYRIVHIGVSPDPHREQWHVRAILLR